VHCVLLDFDLENQSHAAAKVVPLSGLRCARPWQSIRYNIIPEAAKSEPVL
jgi:hypothetical protein